MAVTLREEGYTIKEIARKLGNGATVSGVQKVWQKYKSTKSCKTTPRTGRKAKVHIVSDKKVVCREAFASLHGIGVKRVRRITSLAAIGLTPQNRKGCHNTRPTAININITERIEQHIRSFPVKVTHYGKRQNQNNTMVRYWFTQVFVGRFEEVVHRFPIQGSSYLPCDRHFDVIQRKQKKVEKVEIPSEWTEFVKRHFQVVEMTHTDFKDFDGYFTHFFKKSGSHNGEVFQVSKYKIFQYHPLHKHQVEVSKLMSRMVMSSFLLFKNNVTPNLNVPQLYHGQLPVKSAKVHNVSKFLKYLSENAQQYLQSIKDEEGSRIQNDDSD
ncbi:hypothetical protein ANN_17766 [Periplaneta americana]|uniref:Uncharacterized protein n=1 Tax=Periplaneta americana TaxID=6978 RepID=A0ABQ8STW1_PERAM|nr:hypothetical protein ANN_17766 [Periplaneta americana]